jgi:hypothetical protein
MIQPENMGSGDHKSQASQELDFQQQFDGYQPALDDAERQVAAFEFHVLVTDVLKDAADKGVAKVIKVSKSMGASTFAFFQRSFPDGSRIKISVARNDIVPGDLISPPIEVSVDELRRGRVHSSSQYTLAHDGSEVVRFDSRAEELLGQVRPYQTEDILLPGKAGDDAFRLMMKETDDVIENTELEREMKVNNQPVSTKEIELLWEMIEQAEIDRNPTSDE